MTINSIYRRLLASGASARPATRPGRPRLGVEALEGREVPATFIGTQLDDVFVGTPQNDIIIGRGGEDVLSGEGGNDVVIGGQGDDVISGGAGHDSLTGNGGDDVLKGGAGRDTLVGGAGADTADFSDLAAGVSVDLDRGRAISGADQDTLVRIDNVTGTSFSDVITGDRRDNVIDAGAAADAIDAGKGDDVVSGAAGVDTITLGHGRDTVVFDRTAIGSGPDQIADFSFPDDRYLLDAADFGVTGGLKFINSDAAGLAGTDANVIVLRDGDDDGNPLTAFNARSAARLIAARGVQAGPGFFVYFNSALNVNRLAYTPDLANGEAGLTLLAAQTGLTGPAAVAALPAFTAENFAFRGETLVGTAGIDALTGFGGDDVISGKAGVDQITLGGGRDTVAFDTTAIGSGPDQISDFSLTEDRFRLDAARFGVTRPLTFANVSAAGLAGSMANVIVLRDGDDDGNPLTAFNARSAARLIAARGVQAGPGFFVYFNSALNVNRLAYTPDLANGEAPLTLLAALNNVTGPAAVAALPAFTAENFSF